MIEQQKLSVKCSQDGHIIYYENNPLGPPMLPGHAEYVYAWLLLSLRDLQSILCRSEGVPTFMDTDNLRIVGDTLVRSSGLQRKATDEEKLLYESVKMLTVIAVASSSKACELLDIGLSDWQRVMSHARRYVQSLEAQTRDKSQARSSSEPRTSDRHSSSDS